jgi:hypothetical protein
MSLPPPLKRSFRLWLSGIFALLFLLWASYLAVTYWDPLLKPTDTKKDIELTLATVAPLGMSRAEVVKLLPKLGIYDWTYYPAIEQRVGWKKVESGGSIASTFSPNHDPAVPLKTERAFTIRWGFDAKDQLTFFEVSPKGSS